MKYKNDRDVLVHHIINLVCILTIIVSLVYMKVNYNYAGSNSDELSNAFLVLKIIFSLLVLIIGVIFFEKSRNIHFYKS